MTVRMIVRDENTVVDIAEKLTAGKGLPGLIVDLCRMNLERGFTIELKEVKNA